jgi:hypothetical protein
MGRGKKADYKNSSGEQDQPRETVERELAETQPVESESSLDATVANPGSEQPSEVTFRGDEMEQGKGTFEGFSELTRNFFSLDAAKKVAEVCIETAEKFADGALECQAKSTEWAKATPLASLFEVQNSMGRKLAELSAETARRLWHLEERHGA